MKFSLSAIVTRTCLLTGLAFSALFSATAQADVIDIDLSGVDPRFHDVFRRAEAQWESRIQNFSNELPQAFLMTLPRVRIVARTPLIDGPGGILGGASTKLIMQYQTLPGTTFTPIQKAFPVAALLQIDSGDFPTNDQEAAMFYDTVLHEIGHVLGIGSLWARNGLIAPVNGVGLTQYVGGQYAIRTYQREANQPFATFIPIEQQGGPGSALAHWAENDAFFNQVFSGPFRKEVMTAFACDITPNGDFVCAPTFLSETTWASLADTGWEVAGINDNDVDPPAPGALESRWPKITGASIIAPFAGTQIDIAPGISLRSTDITVYYRSAKKAVQGPNGGVKTDDAIDIYGLRNQRWVK